MAPIPIAVEQPDRAKNAVSARFDDRSFSIFSDPAVAKLAALHYAVLRRDLWKGYTMMKIATRLVMAAAAASMAVTPIAAQANTRAGDNGSVYSVAAAPGLGRAAEGESAKSGFSIILGLFAAAAIIGGIILASSSDDKGQSPGT
jgi:hypothetical protein